MRARILDYDDKFAPGCCDDENGKTVPLVYLPDYSDSNLPQGIVGHAELSTTIDGVDAEITVFDSILKDAVIKIMSDGEADALDPLILKTEGVLDGICTKCRILQISVIPKEE